MKSILLLVLLLVSPVVQARDLKVVMFRVFHGDLIYVELPDGKNMIVDTGKKGKPEKFLFPYLKKNGIKKIDYLILSHMDYDHIGGAAEVLKKYPIDVVWYNGHRRNTKPQIAYEKVASSKKIPIVILDTDPFLTEPRILKMTPNLKMEIFHPLSKTESNDRSLVFKLNYKDFSMLFAGDVPKETQKILYKRYGKKLKANVYKVAHHGDHTYKPFIEAVDPEISICPCAFVPFFYPKRKTVKLLKKQGRFYSVRKYGNITITTNGHDFRLTHSKKR
ncbi:MBL fold metallo-hydrolase [bacterium]|nr:MBL fold metallo-hydrolase [bacterium]